MRVTPRHLAATLGLAATLALTACGNDGSTSGTAMDGMGGQTSSSSPAQTGRVGDVMFSQMMVPHHEQAVEMADLALKNDSASTEVKSLAQQIKAAQDPEISTMNGWLKEWNAPASAEMNHGGSDGMMSAEDMASLEKASGAEFDRLWLTMMVQHHQGAIEMAQGVLDTSSDTRVKALASAIIDGQKKEIATMQGLLG
ncbi:MAG: DUF305 domain-containing protein [Pedococcus sp.]